MRATGSPSPLARPRAKKAADRSSMWDQRVMAGWRAAIITRGVEREPGAKTDVPHSGAGQAVHERADVSPVGTLDAAVVPRHYAPPSSVTPAAERAHHGGKLDPGLFQFRLGVGIAHNAAAAEQGRLPAVHKRRPDGYGKLPFTPVIDPSDGRRVPAPVEALHIPDEGQGHVPGNTRHRRGSGWSRSTKSSTVWPPATRPDTGVNRCCTSGSRSQRGSAGMCRSVHRGATLPATPGPPPRALPAPSGSARSRSPSSPVHGLVGVPPGRARQAPWPHLAPFHAAPAVRARRPGNNARPGPSRRCSRRGGAPRARPGCATRDRGRGARAHARRARTTFSSSPGGMRPAAAATSAFQGSGSSVSKVRTAPLWAAAPVPLPMALYSRCGFGQRGDVEGALLPLKAGQLSPGSVSGSTTAFTVTHAAPCPTDS